MDNILKQLSFIAEKVSNSNIVESSGLLSGKMGQAIFLFEYSKLDKEYHRQACQILDAVFEAISNGELFHTYCAGLSGICSGLHYLQQGKYISDDDFVSEEIDSYLKTQLLDCINKDNYDFLHGAIGIGLYYCERYHNNKTMYKEQLQLIINFLSNSAIFEDSCVKWKTIKQEKISYNISLSHGISSIIIFLCKILKTGESDSLLIKNLIEGSVNYLLKQRMDESKIGSFFPYSSLEEELNQKKSRLAWCYGDLGIALALFNASEVLHRRDLYDFAMEVFEFSCKRRDLIDNLVYDATLCHGSSGISLIFNYMYLKTKNSLFLGTAQYWIDKTMEMCDFSKNDGNLKIFYNNITGKYEIRLGILEGLAGIGLTLLSFYNKKPPLWSKFLLLD